MPMQPGGICAAVDQFPVGDEGAAAVAASAPGDEAADAWANHERRAALRSMPSFGY